MSEVSESQDVEVLYEDLLANDGWSCADDAPGAVGSTVRCTRGDESVTGSGEDRDAALRAAFNQTEGGLRAMLRSLGWSDVETGGDEGAVTASASRGDGASVGSVAIRIEGRGASEREALTSLWEQAARRAENQD